MPANEATNEAAIEAAFANWVQSVLGAPNANVVAHLMTWFATSSTAETLKQITVFRSSGSNDMPAMFTEDMAKQDNITKFQAVQITAALRNVAVPLPVLTADEPRGNDQQPDNTTTRSAPADAAAATDKDVTVNDMPLAIELAIKQLHPERHQQLIDGVPALQLDDISTALHSHQQAAVHYCEQRESLGAGHIKGGILADEMGLGKTLTMIALAVHSKRNNSNIASYAADYTDTTHMHKAAKVCICNNATKGNADTVQCDRCKSVMHRDCWEACGSECLYCFNNAAVADRIKTNATLFIVPRALVHQTLDEIEKHCFEDAVRYEHYLGINHIMKQSLETRLQLLSQCDPRKLGANDFIVMAVEDVKMESSHMTSGNAVQFARRRDTVMQLLSPLACLDLKLVVVDEADASIL
jgi:SNF2-related domain